MTSPPKRRKLWPMADTTATNEGTPGLAFLTYVLQALVEDKDELSIESCHDELGILLTVKVSERDMGKVIGKGGQTIKALRILLRMIGGNASERVNIKILEPLSS